jgi:hypothetical protein
VLGWGRGRGRGGAGLGAIGGWWGPWDYWDDVILGLLGCRVSRRPLDATGRAVAVRCPLPATHKPVSRFKPTPRTPPTHPPTHARRTHAPPPRARSWGAPVPPPPPHWLLALRAVDRVWVAGRRRRVVGAGPGPSQLISNPTAGRGGCWEPSTTCDRYGCAGSRHALPPAAPAAESAPAATDDRRPGPRR